MNKYNHPRRVESFGMILIWVFSIIQVNICAADFGDYVDPTFDCPAMTTCPVVCVASAEDCPQEMRCPENQQLCADGSCQDVCWTNDNLVSPCEQDCAPVACPRVIAPFEVCMSTYSSYYERECPPPTYLDDKDAYNDEYHPSWMDPGFMLVYLWIITNTVGMIAWSWYK